MSSSVDSQLPEANAPLADFGLGPDPLLDEVAFPRLSEAELAEVALFGERRSFAKDEALFCAGDYPFNSHAILSGRIRIETGKNRAVRRLRIACLFHSWIPTR